MEDNNGVITIVLLLLLPITAVTSYKAGVSHEAKHWIKVIPDQMRKLCLECAGLEK